MKIKSILKIAKSFLPRYSDRKLRRLLRKKEIGIMEVEYKGVPIVKDKEPTS